MKLFEIADEIAEILEDEVDQETGELTEHTASKLDGLEMKLEERALQVAAYAAGEESQAKAIRETIDRLVARANTHERRFEWLKGYLEANLHQGFKAEDAQVRISTRESTFAQLTVTELESIELFLGDDQLQKFLEHVPSQEKIRKGEILNALRAGREVPGWRLGRRWSVQIK